MEFRDRLIATLRELQPVLDVDWTPDSPGKGRARVAALLRRLDGLDREQE